MYCKRITDLTINQYYKYLKDFLDLDTIAEIFIFPTLTKQLKYIEFGINDKFYITLNNKKYVVTDEKNINEKLLDYKELFKRLKFVFDKIKLKNKVLIKAYFLKKNNNFYIFPLQYNTKLFENKYNQEITELHNISLNQNIYFIRKNILFFDSIAKLKEKLPNLINFLEKRLERYKINLKEKNNEILLKNIFYTEKFLTTKYLNKINKKLKFVDFNNKEHPQILFNNFYSYRIYFNKNKQIRIEQNNQKLYIIDDEQIEYYNFVKEIISYFYSDNEIFFNPHYLNNVINNFYLQTNKTFKNNPFYFYKSILNFIKTSNPDYKTLTDTEIKYIFLNKLINKYKKYLLNNQNFIDFYKYITSITNNLLSDIFILKFILKDYFYKII